MGSGEVREEGAGKGPERRERRRSRGRGCWRVLEDATEGTDGGGRGEAAEGSRGGEHGRFTGGESRAEGAGPKVRGFGSFRLVGLGWLF